jgi:hypothetical protein
MCQGICNIPVLSVDVVIARDGVTNAATKREGKYVADVCCPVQITEMKILASFLLRY